MRPNEVVPWLLRLREQTSADEPIDELEHLGLRVVATLFLNALAPVVAVLHRSEFAALRTHEDTDRNPVGRGDELHHLGRVRPEVEDVRRERADLRPGGGEVAPHAVLELGDLVGQLVVVVLVVVHRRVDIDVHAGVHALPRRLGAAADVLVEVHEVVDDRLEDRGAVDVVLETVCREVDDPRVVDKDVGGSADPLRVVRGADANVVRLGHVVSRVVLVLDDRGDPSAVLTGDDEVERGGRVVGTEGLVELARGADEQDGVTPDAREDVGALDVGPQRVLLEEFGRGLLERGISVDGWVFDDVRATGPYGLRKDVDDALGDTAALVELTVETDGDDARVPERLVEVAAPVELETDVLAERAAFHEERGEGTIADRGEGTRGWNRDHVAGAAGDSTRRLRIEDRRDVDRATGRRRSTG